MILKILKYGILVLGLCLISSCEDGIFSDNCQDQGPSPDCICTAQYDPVCGCNGKTYSNACTAGCSGIDSFVAGECPK